MRYIKFFGNAGFAGTGYEHYIAFPAETSDEVVNDWSDNFADECIDSYSWMAEDMDEEERDFYFENSGENCGWYDISKLEWEENDGEEVD